MQIIGAGPPILFVHGAPNAGATWAPLMTELTGFRCYLLDRPGTGLSAPLPSDWSVERILAYGDGLVADTFDALGLDRADVVASSFGGYLALRSAAAHPDRVTRMVQMSSPGAVPGMSVPGFMRMLTTPFVGGLIRRLPPSRRSTRSVMRQMGHGYSLNAGRFPDAILDWYMALQRDTDTMHHDGNLLAAASSGRGRFAEELFLRDDTLNRVKARTLFLWGADDGFGGPHVGADLVRRIPDATLEVFEHGGHLPWLDDPAKAAAGVMSWLQ